MHTLFAWVKASRLSSQSLIFFPLLLGQAFYAALGNRIDWLLFAAIHFYGLADQLFIVYANDYADLETDRMNTTFTPFTGGSRVLVDGNLRPRHLRNGALLMAGVCVVIGLGIGLSAGHWTMLPAIVAGLLLLWAYSYPPVCMSYRGMGELLQVLGVGVILPVVGFTGQGGALRLLPWSLLGALLPSQFAAALSTSIPDEPSDRRSAKRTSAVIFGLSWAPAIMVGMHLLSLLLLATLGRSWLPSPDRFWVLGLAAGCLIGQLTVIRAQPGDRAMTALVFLSISTTLVLTGGTAWVLWLAAQ